MTTTTETRYAVQWKYHGNWVTYNGDYTSEKDTLRDLAKAKEDDKAQWRAVEITVTTRRIDSGDV